MIRLLESLPSSVEVDGGDYSICTDFRYWMRFELMIVDPDTEDWALNQIIVEGFQEETLPPHRDNALRALLWFYTGGRNPAQDGGEGGSAKTIYHFEKDAEMIYASFLSAYGVDLAAVAHLHWWKFRAMLHHISPDAAIGRVMGLRATDDSELSEAQRRLKRLCEIGRRGAPMTLSRRDEALRARAREAKRRTELARREEG